MSGTGLAARMQRVCLLARGGDTVRVARCPTRRWQRKVTRYDSALRLRRCNVLLRVL